LPGPTWSFTKQRSFPAVGVVDVGVPVSRRESPFLNCFTNSTVVLASGVKAVFMESSQVSATGADAGAGVEGVDPPPPQPGSEITATSAVVAAANVRQVGSERVRGLVFTTRWALVERGLQTLRSGIMVSLYYLGCRWERAVPSERWIQLTIAHTYNTYIFYYLFDDRIWATYTFIELNARCNVGCWILTGKSTLLRKYFSAEIFSVLIVEPEIDWLSALIYLSIGMIEGSSPRTR
jgi:hypothetical protein